MQLNDFPNFVGNIVIDICIVTRFPEYIPVACLNGVKTFYILHDFANKQDIIAKYPNLLGIFCVSEWHKSQFLSLFANCESITGIISHGIETDLYPIIEKEKYTFIYSSFADRGLLQLLKMWKKIVERYPTAHLNIFCNLQHKWSQMVAENEMVEIQKIINENRNSITNHGWVNGKILREFWAKSHIWFYPCTYEETCCLSAWEAAASKTLVVTNHLAALKTSVGNRGVIIEGDARQQWWHDTALQRLFQVLDSNGEKEYTEKNYEWVKTKNFKNVVNDFERNYISYILN